MAEPSYYRILGLRADCSPEELTRNYRKLALKYHPDKNPEGVEKFKMITKAYKVLGDTEARHMYDLGGETNVVNAFTDFSQRFDFAWKDLEELLNWIPKEKNSNITHSIWVSLEMVYTGGSVSEIVSKRISCTSCTGRYDKSCFLCGGSKILTEQKVYNILIKKGMCNLQEIYMVGEGDVTPTTAPGDRIFQVHLKPHPIYLAQGACNLSRNVDIPLALALNGGMMQIETLDKRQLCFKITDRIKSGDEKLIRNEGMPDYWNPGKKGDMLLKITFILPDYIQERQLLQTIFSANSNKDTLICSCPSLRKKENFQELIGPITDEALLNSFPNQFYNDCLISRHFQMWKYFMFSLLALSVSLIMIIFVYIFEND